MTNRVKMIREHFGMSQQKFADSLGIPRSNISMYETDRELTPAVRSLICKTFDVNPEWLDTGAGDMFIEVDPEDDLMEWAADVLRDKPESFRRRIVTALRVFSMEDWEEIEKLCDKLLEANKKTAPEGAADGTTEDSAG